MINELINTCAIGGSAVRTVVYYSHIVPIILSLLLGSFILIKAKFNFFSKAFSAFILIFSLWLVGDTFAWNSLNYNIVYASWSVLDYIEIVFYALGLYFALVFVKKSDISAWWKIFLFTLTLPALYLTVTLQSVTGFNQPICEAFNNNFIGQYKIILEGIILTIILGYAIAPFFNNFSWNKARVNLIVLGSMFTFLATFAITEYLASVTGYYELNLYSLFLLPVFIISIIYAVFELDIFNFKILGTHYLVIGLIVLMGGQLFFITNTTNRLLTILAMLFALGISFILFKNLKKESDQRLQIEKLNKNLNETIKQRESLVHLVTHKVKGAFTRSKYIFAGILDGTFGETSIEIQKIAQQGLESDNTGIETVDLVLNVSNMQKGTVKYEMKDMDLKELVDKTVAEKRDRIETKGLTLENTSDTPPYHIKGDPFWLKEAISNLIDNAFKYTLKGKITIKLEKKEGNILLSVMDTGIGLTKEDKDNLFTEGGRGKESVKVNVDSTGYGLFSVKLIVEAHNGHVWGESEGTGKGSAFFLEIPEVK